MDDLYQHIVDSFNRDAALVDFKGFEFVADPDPVCFTAENGRLVRFDPGKEPA